MIVIKALQRVFRKPLYVIIAFVTSITVFVLAVWLPNISLILRIMGHPQVSLAQKINLPLSLLGSITTNFTLLSASYTISIAVLFGVNLSMMVYFLNKRIAKAKQSGTALGFLGIISGALGMGCAACGSLLLTSMFSLVGASWILGFLPLAGGEFGVLGVILLLISIYLTAKQIQNPTVCRVK